MKGDARARWWRLPLPRTPVLSPLGLLTRAAAITVAWLLLHLAGAREATAIFSGTGGVPSLGTALAAVAYAACYLGAVVLAPILAIAAPLQLILARLLGDGGSAGG